MIESTLFYYPTAFALGVLHSFEPAHGKAVLAAYIVGNRRSVVDAVLFGLVIAVTHTFSILLLGFGAWAAAEQYHIALTGPVFSLIGGLLVLGVGFWMLLRWRMGACAHPGHGHHEHDHPEKEARKNGKTATGSSRGRLLVIGIGGGLVPCPAGVAMLMTAVAAGHLAQGLGLAVAFSLGAGVVVVALSVVVTRASDAASRWMSEDSPFMEHLPLVSSLLVIGVGMWLSASAFLGVMGGSY